MLNSIFLLTPEEHPRLYSYLLFCCEVCFERKNKSVTNKISWENSFTTIILFGITGNSSYCSDTDVDMNIGNTNEVRVTGLYSEFWMKRMFCAWCFCCRTWTRCFLSRSGCNCEMFGWIKGDIGREEWCTRIDTWSVCAGQLCSSFLLVALIWFCAYTFIMK